MMSGNLNFTAPRPITGSVPGTMTSSAESLDACWSRVGVTGDASCPELATHIHCRNCPAYARAGALLLNRPLPPEYRREWTAHVAGLKQRAGATDSSATLFRIGNEWLALNTALVQEVAEHRPLHSLPHRRLGIVLGLVNVRGELVICVSLARLLQLDRDVNRERARRSYHRLIVFNPETGRFAFPVDEVHGVHRFNRAELQPPPATVARDQHTMTLGLLTWRAQTVGYLDGAALGQSLNEHCS